MATASRRSRRPRRVLKPAQTQHHNQRAPRTDEIVSSAPPPQRWPASPFRELSSPKRRRLLPCAPSLLRIAGSMEQLAKPVVAHLRMAGQMQVTITSAGDDVQTWRALDRAEAAVGRVATDDPPSGCGYSLLTPGRSRLADSPAPCGCGVPMLPTRPWRPAWSDGCWTPQAGRPGAAGSGLRTRPGPGGRGGPAGGSHRHRPRGTHTIRTGVEPSATVPADNSRHAPPGPLSDVAEHLHIADTRKRTVR